MDDTESILTSIKKLLGPDEEETHFDPDIIMHINTSIMDLTQNGIGPEDGFLITSKDEKWSDFITTTPKKFQAVKTYIYIQVRLVFDPPTSSALTESLKVTADKILERLKYNAEGYA